MLDGNVVSRKDVEAAIQKLGDQAEGAGLTTKQVCTFKWGVRCANTVCGPMLGP